MSSEADPDVIRLHIVVEGQTEETFVRDLLAPELAARATVVDVHRITTGRKKGVPHRGGFVAYDHLRNDLSLWIKQERRRPEARFTTMIDLYGLPQDFPGKLECQRIQDPLQKVAALEARILNDLNDPRLVPYIQLHEFEALLFSSPDAFLSAFPASDPEIEELRRISEAFESPEHIDDGRETAPSKRICKIFPGYVKTSFGLLIAKTIGLPRMRSECKHFDSWIETLYRL
jgi:hypothetical protein